MKKTVSNEKAQNKKAKALKGKPNSAKCWKKIELALSISNPKQFSFWKKGFKRIYFGAETCERLLPGEKDLLAAKKFCRKNRLGFSLVTPFLTEAGLKSAVRLVRLLSKKDELVVNDYGLLQALKGKKPRLVAGRLLNRQYRDPRIPSFKGKVPQEFLLHLSQSFAGSEEAQRFLLHNGFERVELDNLPLGIGTCLSDSGLQGSVYTPFNFVSATRLCLSANCDNLWFYNKIGVFPCKRECQRYQFTLNSPGLGMLFMFGNAVFAKSPPLPPEEKLLQRGINRIVVNTTIQLFQK